MSDKKKINYLVGKSAKLNISLFPFNKIIVEFLDDLSKNLNYFNKPNFTDIKALSFFCRKNNIFALKNKYLNQDSVRFGLGLLFHITPANIPTNFAYSLIFGLLTGNSNLVKVPSKEFPEIEIICKSINKLLKKKKYIKIKHMISIVRYNDYDQFTKKYSSLCDGRLIWGGDQTINNIRKYSVKAKNIDIPFSDRYSISLINLDKFSNLSNFKKRLLIQKFYNDTYDVDQNACSSPHMVLWTGNYKKKINNIFWSMLNSYVKKKYDPPLISSIDNYSKFVEDAIKAKNTKNIKKLSSSLYVASLKKLKNNTLKDKTKWGYFYECHIKNLNEIKFVTNRNLQTITYFGFSKKFLKYFFSLNNFNGIDRIVPIGQALNINLIWDGYDLSKILTREIEIR